MSLSLQTRFLGNVYIIQCAGRIVSGPQSDALESALNLAAREFTRVVLNFAEVTRLDSMGLGLLVRYSTRLKKSGGDMRLAAPPAFVATLLNLTRLSAIIPSYPTEEDAILSFLSQRPVQAVAEKNARKLLVFDSSPDLCTFVRGIMMQHGFDVRTSCSFRDARLLLRVDPVDYILAGPGIPHLSYAEFIDEIKTLAPRASALQLTPGFKSQDALHATHLLLEMFGVEPKLATESS